ncbi:hypothetical protein [Microbacterium allomyrinae]|uniref:Uncharacterized protein n=1 Tax=Microbacterium allomyrinae TaxID=2830666 RepID=A0A9X1LUF8_9MICO|nr:hypothetical protein [Microbacterium allomyrinae]MCC2032185.1 hypothetical protein [Microbacterium allomyrinae]
MVNDPTARRAEKSVAAAAMTDTIAINGGEPLRVSRATSKAITSQLDIQYSPSAGEYFATLKADQ